MLQLDAVEFTQTTAALQRVQSLIESGGHDDEDLGDKVLKRALNHLGELVKAMAPLELDLSRASCERLKSLLENGIVTDMRGLRENLGEIENRIYDELHLRVVYCVSPSKVSFAKEGPKIFGDAVLDKFPAAAYDIECASKCLAFEQSTACVFHLMRVMEIAVDVLASKFTGGKIQKEWGKLLSDINGGIESLPRGPERDHWSENFAMLYHVKQAWRNSTMHPKRQYSAQEAETIFTAVRVFMIDLADLA